MLQDTKVESVRRLPDWRQIRAEDFLLPRCLAVVEAALEMDSRLSTLDLARVLKVPQQTLQGIFNRYPKIGQILACHQRSLIRLQASRMHNHRGIGAFAKYQEAIRNIESRHEGVTAKRIAECLNLQRDTVTGYIKRHKLVVVLAH